VSRFAGHRQVVGSGAAGLVGAAGQAAMARPVMSAQIRTAWAVVEALVLTMLDPGHDLPLGRAIALQLVGDHSPHYQIDRLLPSKLIHLMVPSAQPLESVFPSTVLQFHSRMINHFCVSFVVMVSSFRGRKRD
jgi:hypothetical protein